MLIRLCNVCIGLGHGTEVREMTNEAKPDNVECPIDTDCKMVRPECNCKCNAHISDCT